jgi:hypothetical protein
VLTELFARIDKFRTHNSVNQDGGDAYIRWRYEVANEGEKRKVIATILGRSRENPEKLEEKMWSEPSKNAQKALKNLETRVNSRHAGMEREDGEMSHIENGKRRWYKLAG